MKSKTKKTAAFLIAALLVCVNGIPASQNDSYTTVAKAETIAEQAVPLSGEPAISNVLLPVPSGKSVQKNDKALIDYSNTSEGYIMMRYTASTSKRLKVQIARDGGTTYTYNLGAGSSYTTFPLSDGNGSYKATIFENVTGTSYATVLSASFNVTLDNEFSPFLLPNQYVNYNVNTKCVVKSRELTSGLTNTLDKVSAVYNFVVENFTYDYAEADSVQSGYTPVLDSVYDAKKGICFDYAATMTAMLRSQNIPTKLVVGYSGNVYHAWINVYTKESGWVDAAIYFDGIQWKLMDPTFASTGKQDPVIMQYIGNASNYVEKYLY